MRIFVYKRDDYYQFPLEPDYEFDTILDTMKSIKFAIEAGFDVNDYRIEVDGQEIPYQDPDIPLPKDKLH